MKKELRRKDAIYSPEFVGAEKLLFIPLSSSVLGLQGNVDWIIKTVRRICSKWTTRIWLQTRDVFGWDHKYQLVAYALLVENHFGTVVRRGFVDYIPKALILQLEIMPSMKSYVKRVLGHIKRIIKEEELPPIRVAKQKCTGGCGHKQTCYVS